MKLSQLRSSFALAVTISLHTLAASAHDTSINATASESAPLLESPQQQQNYEGIPLGSATAQRTASSVGTLDNLLPADAYDSATIDNHDALLAGITQATSKSERKVGENRALTRTQQELLDTQTHLKQKLLASVDTGDLSINTTPVVVSKAPQTLRELLKPVLDGQETLSEPHIEACKTLYASWLAHYQELTHEYERLDSNIRKLRTDNRRLQTLVEQEAYREGAQVAASPSRSNARAPQPKMSANRTGRPQQQARRNDSDDEGCCGCPWF